jgi:thiamine biosynthesis protein ThiS
MIKVNRRHEIPWQTGMTVRDVLKAMNYTYPHIVVTVNGDVVRHDDYDNHEIPDEADVQVIHMIAGG